MASPLFPRFNRLVREQKDALRQWQQAQSAVKSARRGSVPRSGRPMQYGAGGNWLWNSVLRKLGPLGEVIDAMLRPNGQSLAPSVQKELDAAQHLLESFGFTVGGPGQSASPLTRELIEDAPPSTGRPSRPDGEIDSPTMPRRRTRRGTPSEHSQSETVAPQPTVPLTQGMIPVTSSNVHSIGYEWPADDRQPGNLLVRFLAGTGRQRSGPGPLYRYKDVPREVFLAFQRAASKGKFVWDELRVRGTVSGHQYDYDLAGTGLGDYVPRQAGLARGQKGEFYMQRSFKGRRSTLPTQQVRGPRGELTTDFRRKAAMIAFLSQRRIR